ncbi:MAG: DUF5309 family protein [Mesotoga sp.]|nr:DUF5309 family protein [Mesotoga sp.]
MGFNIGLHTEYDDPISILDPLVLIAAKRVKMGAHKGALYNAMKAPTQSITQKVFQIYGRSFTERKGALRGSGWGSSATTGLPISDALANVITKGTVLKVGNELVIVKSVTRTAGAGTIDVYARGAGGTTPATHAATDIATGISHAGNDTDLKSVESFSENSNGYINYAQTVFETIDYTKAQEIIGRKGLGEANIPQLQGEAMQRVANFLASTVLWSRKQEGKKTLPSMTAGLFQQLEDTAGINSSTRVVNRHDFANATFNETNFKLAMDKAFRAGNPDTILCSKAVKNKFNNFNAGIIKTDRTDKTAGYDITAYEIEGKRLSFLVDEDMPDNRICVLTIGLCQKGWLEGDMLRIVDEPSASSREMRASIQGTVGVIIDGVGYDHLDIYNVGA